MVLPLCIFYCALLGSLAAREPDIDINRLRLVPKEQFAPGSLERRSVSEAYKSNTNDYDDHSSRIFRSPTSLHSRVPPLNWKTTKAPLKVHQPREDPRLFYQSDAYLKENNGQNVNHEVSLVYPGKEVIRQNADYVKSMPIRLKDKGRRGSNFCVRCPHDRTVVAKTGSDRVILQTPRLLSCSGRRTPRNIYFKHLYGPKFGSLIKQGSHMVVGRIMHKDKGMQLCKMQVHVVVHSCVTPKYLISRCETNKSCSFTCRDPKLKLNGQSTLSCGPDLTWIGDLPICRARTWCDTPRPPVHGRISCKGATARANYGLVEGSKCRIRCASGWRWYPRPVSVCRRGSWTNPLTCKKFT